MTIFILAAVAGAVVLAAAATYRALHGWRVARGAAWETERAAWRRWITEPRHALTPDEVGKGMNGL